MRKLKQLLAAVLAASVVLNMPACMETVEAGQMRRRMPIPVDIPAIQEPSEEVALESETGDTSSESSLSMSAAEETQSGAESQPEESAEEAQSRIETEPEESTETQSGIESEPEESAKESQSGIESEPEESTEAPSRIETEPEESTEAQSGIESEPEESEEEPSQTMPEELPEDAATENMPEDPTQEYPENGTENNTEENTGDLLCPMQIIPEVTSEGVLDYRTYLEAEELPKLVVRLEECAEDTDLIEMIALQNDDSVEEQMHFYLQLEEDGIVKPHYFEEACVYDPDKACFKDAAALELLRVGETAYTVEVLGEYGREIDPGSGVIKVCNSPMLDSDFYIEVVRGGQVQTYTYKAWEEYLKAHDNWVDGEVRIQLSDTGQKYYTTIETEETASEASQKTYTFWAENPERNASTKEEENGTRSYTAGVDKEAPVLAALQSDSVCFEQTKTDTLQYYAEDFVLEGTFEDTQSGLGRIEYTTQATLEEQAEWTTLDVSDGGTFRIVLADGCYDAIAVRAYDRLGNASRAHGFVNEKGEYI